MQVQYALLKIVTLGYLGLIKLFNNLNQNSHMHTRNIVLNQLSFKIFNKAGAAIKVFGGENRADIIKIQNVIADDSFSKVFEIGSDITEIIIEK